jgi:hypothetical protein
MLTVLGQAWLPAGHDAEHLPVESEVRRIVLRKKPGTVGYYRR